MLLKRRHVSTKCQPKFEQRPVETPSRLARRPRSIGLEDLVLTAGAGEILPTNHRSVPKPYTRGPNLAEAGWFLSQGGRHRARCGRFRAKVGRPWPKVGRFQAERPILTRISRPLFHDSGPDSAELQAELGRILPQHRPKSKSTDRRQIRPNLARSVPASINLDSVRPIWLTSARAGIDQT